MVWNKEETNSRSEMQSLQLGRLQETVSYVYEKNPHYRKKLDEIEIKPRDIRSLDDIRSLLALKGSSACAASAAESALGAIDEQIHSLEDKLTLFTRLRSELLQAREMLTSCKDCKNVHCFPNACDDCEVVSDSPTLPTSMRVLWSVGGGGD